MKNTVEKKKLDYEWIELMKEAKVVGLDLEDIRQFLIDFEERK